MISAEEARKGLKELEVINWRKIGDGRLSKIFSLIKNDTLDRIDTEIRKASVVGMRKKSKKLAYSLNFEFSNIVEMVKNEVRDGTITTSKEKIVSDMMCKELELVVCAELRQAGYSVSMDRHFIRISWEEE